MATDLVLRGVIYSVPDDSLAEMKRLGATTPTEDDYKREAAGQGLESVKAAGEAAFRGATMGFGERALKYVEGAATGDTPDEVAERMRLRKEQNPGIDFAGQVAGNIGTTLLTGGVGVLGKAAQGVGLIGKAAEVGRLGRVALAAGEGGLWGLGSEVSESALENRGIIAERAGQSMVAGLLLGGGLGAGTEAIGALKDATVKALGSKSLKEGLNKAADTVERRALFKGQPDEWLETEGIQPHMQARMREHGVSVEATPENMHKMEQARANTSGKAIGEDIARAQEVLPLSGDVEPPPVAPAAPTRTLADDIMEPPGSGPPVRPVEPPPVVAAARSLKDEVHEAFASQGNDADKWKTLGKFENPSAAADAFDQLVKEGKLAESADAVQAAPAAVGISNEVRVAEALKAVHAKQPPGALLTMGQVRDAAGLPKADFDAAMLALREKRQVSLHRHDFPRSLSEERRAAMVHDGKTYYVGVVPHENLGEGLGAAAAEVPAPEAATFRVQVLKPPTPAEVPVRARVAQSALGEDVAQAADPFAAFAKASEEAARAPKAPPAAEPVLTEGARNRKEWADTLKAHLESKFGENPNYNTYLSQVKSHIDELAANKDLNLKKLWDWQSTIFDKLPMAEKSKVSDRVLSEARDFTRDWVTEKAAAAIPEMADQIRKNAKDYAADSAVWELLKAQTKKEQTSGIGGFSWRNAWWGGTIAGGAVGGALGGPLGAVVGGLGGMLTHHFLAQKGGAIAVNAMRALADSSLLSGMSKGLQNRWLTAIRMAPDLMTPFRGPIEAAFASGHQQALATHAYLAQGPNGADYLHALNYKPESPDELQQASERMAALHAIERHNLQQQAAMDAAVSAFFGGKAGRPVSLGVSTKDFAKKLEAVKSGNALQALKSLPPDLMNAAPATMSEAVMAMQKALDYLKANAPKDPNAGLPAALQRPWKPSEAEKEKWLRRVEAVQSPEKVIASLGKSSVTREHIETIAAVYPQLMGDLQVRMAARLSEYQGTLSYEKRVALSHVLGPAALGITPAQVMVMQSTFQKAAAGPQPGAGSSRRDGRQKVDQQKNLQTQAQRLEGR